eukprot:GHUV01017154.1.p1 GENE.GHUV01017154.1~~GHUV01017154.1.p1  ORF type:complete len:167 (-),score=2.33 GHUV01017154.1:456-956(-)
MLRPQKTKNNSCHPPITAHTQYPRSQPLSYARSCPTHCAYDSLTALADILISCVVTCAKTSFATVCTHTKHSLHQHIQPCTGTALTINSNCCAAPYAYNSLTALADILLISCVVTCGKTSWATVGNTGSSSHTRAGSGRDPFMDPFVRKLTILTTLSTTWRSSSDS